MKISSEAKVGIIGLATLIVLIWGINYLKGRNILNSTYTLHAFFEDSGGIESSAPVLMNGVKIGFIDAIDLLPGVKPPIHVKLHIEKRYPVRRGSTAILYSADLLGSKAIRLEASGQGDRLQHQDTIQSLTEENMFSSVTDQILPVVEQIGGLAESLDSVVLKLDGLLKTEDPAETLRHLAGISASLSRSLKQGGPLYESFQNLESFTSMLESQEEEIDSMTGHLNSIAASLDRAGIDRIAEELIAASGAFTQLMNQLNSGEGSAGKLIYSDSIYTQLQNLLSNLDSLVNDLNENPQDYVHFSLFGK
ncbi:MAG: MlaD family protein [Bacteroidales bacterium]|nr:MlaD family protein [Bacteroidales bacterium]